MACAAAVLASSVARVARSSPVGTVPSGCATSHATSTDSPVTSKPRTGAVPTILPRSPFQNPRTSGPIAHTTPSPVTTMRSHIKITPPTSSDARARAYRDGTNSLNFLVAEPNFELLFHAHYKLQGH